MIDKKRERRTYLGVKLNALTVVVILLVAIGIMSISYIVHSRRIDEFYRSEAEEAARDVAYQMYYPMIETLIERLDTDEFRQVRRVAVEAGDPRVIEDWMKGEPTLIVADAEHVVFGWDEASGDSVSMYDDYGMLVEMLSEIQASMQVACAYIDYMADGVTYHLIDPNEDALILAAEETALPSFAGYADNDRIPATVYGFGDSWLCSAYEPIENDDGVAIAMAGVDIDMNEAMRERRWFLVNSMVFALALTMIGIAVNVLLIHRIAVRPLTLLANATDRFAEGKSGYTHDDVIDVDIRSHDEINALYQKIRDMQTRIVDYTADLEALTAEREHIATEMRLATDIQAAMLPSAFPAFPDRAEFDLHASMRPAKDVGGDFYDFFLIDDDHLALVIADVSGKGVPAALFMMSAMILINDQAMMGGAPSRILAAVNEHICQHNEAKMFVTVWLGILTISTGVLTCANAGHEYPAIRGADGRFRLFRDKHGFVIGGVPGMKYRDYELRLNPGDAVFVYTDGLPEARDANQAFYGTDRAVDALNAAAGQPPKDILAAMQRSVDAFVGGAEQFDDLTMLCLEYRGAPDENPIP